MRTHPVAALVLSLGLAAVACGSDKPSSSATVTSAAGAGGVSASGITPDRCTANKAAGKITYLSSFDFAASASIVDVVVAKQKGYFDKMCLDVDLKSSFSTANYPLVAANTAQFSSGGSYTELVQQSRNGAELVTLAVEGKTGIDALVVRDDGTIQKPADLKGKTIGVKGALPPGEVAMLNRAGLGPNDYKTVLLDGFDPVAHMKLAIDALPVYKSNEPHQLDVAGVKYKLFDPKDSGIPGSFGVLYTSRKFVNEHPSAAQDFVRAAMKGLADAIADPRAAVDMCFKLITDGGNPNYLSDTGEQYRWGVESKIVTDTTPSGEGPGLVHAPDLQKEIDAYTAAGVFPSAPKIDGTYDEALIKGVYDKDGKIIWPTS